MQDDVRVLSVDNLLNRSVTKVQTQAGSANCRYNLLFYYLHSNLFLFVFTCWALEKDVQFLVLPVFLLRLVINLER